jgi:PAS domain S-box-containing protein
MPTDPLPRDEAPHGGRWDEVRRRGTMAELEARLVTGGAAVIATDLDGVITHWSAGAERLYGWSSHEAVGRSVLDLLLAARDRESAQENLARLQRSGSWEGEFDLRRKDGANVLAYVRGTLIKDDAGRSVGLLGLSMDVSP